VLLAFDLAAVLIFRMLHRRDDVAVGPDLHRPLAWFGSLVGLSVLVYLPLLMPFGPTHWFAFGPFAVQASRVGLYALYFFGGVAVGRCGIGRVLLAPDGDLQRYWPRWTSASALLFALVVAVQMVRLSNAARLPAAVWLCLYGVLLAVFSAATGFALLAIFLRFGQRSGRWWESLAANAYGIYLLHYPLVIWMQYALVGTGFNLGLKAVLVFVVALALSWCSVMMLRRIPGAVRII
jgi:peptidoglycan/LPS O-acetylase OafA/YrhL